jgi:diamine N-acetyltransferase
LPGNSGKTIYMTLMTEERITIRTAGIADAVTLAPVAGKIFTETFFGTMPDEDLFAYVSSAFSIQKISGEIRDTSNSFLLAFSGKQLIGYAKLVTTPPPPGTSPGRSIGIDRLYVFAAWHNRKIGASLLQECIRNSQEKGYEFLWLNVWEKNTKAIRFYEKWGFVFIGSRILMRGNEPQRGLDMQKSLQQDQ